MMNLLMWVGDYDGNLPPPAILKPRPLWTGKQMLSLVLPEVNYTRRKADNFAPRKDGKPPVGWACPNDGSVIVKNGDLLCGVMDKGIVGASSGGLVHIVWRDLGPEACKLFLSNT